MTNTLRLISFLIVSLGICASFTVASEAAPMARASLIQQSGSMTTPPLRVHYAPYRHCHTLRADVRCWIDTRRVCTRRVMRRCVEWRTYRVRVCRGRPGRRFCHGMSSPLRRR